MREIKFRAWDREAKVMQFFNLYNPETGHVLQPHIPSRAYDLMQFTGLSDKAGKEVFEGDILNIAGWELPMVVGFQDGSFTVSNPKSAVYHYITAQWLNLLDTEVIGNIYSTPDLLTPQSQGEAEA